MRNPRKLLERISVIDNLDNFDKFLKVLNDIREKYPDRLIEFDYYFIGPTFLGPDEYYYGPDNSIEVCVYDIPRKKEKHERNNL